MFKKYLIGLIISFFLLVSQTSIPFASAQTDTGAVQIDQAEKIPVNVFVRQSCRHCHDEKIFLDNLAKNRNDLEIIYHDIGEKEHKAHFLQITEMEGISKTTPITLVGNVILQGFDSAETTGKRIESLIEKSQGEKTLNFEEYIAQGGKGQIEITGASCTESGSTAACETDSNYLVTVPFLGVIDLREYSLPTLSVILGFVDGFNPCAMWVLVTFLIVLVQIGNKNRMFITAGLFILAETIMYYLILNIWLTTWDFVGLDDVVTPIVGVISIGGAFFFLYEFWTSDGTCKVTNLEQRRKTTQKIHQLIESPLTWLTILGIISLALSVNILEFACSIGIPQAYTKILNLNYLGFLERQMYMLIYIFFYMIDDFIVFGIALYSIEKIGVTHKYARYCNLIGGIAMLILGYLLIFNPTALLF